jgi:hypothetical protein
VGVVEKGPEDASGLKGEHGVDAAEAFGPGATQEFVQYRFCLVVEGVSSGDNVRFAVCHQLAEEGVAEIAGRFLQGFMEGGGSGGCVRAMEVEGQIVGCCEVSDEGRVLVGGFPNAVMNVHHGECDSQGRPLVEQAPEESYGVGAPGDRYGDPMPRMEEMFP